MENQTPTLPKYEMIDHENPNDELINTAIKITDGEFEGTLYRYGKAFFQQTEDAQMIMKFEYELLETEDQQASPELIDVMGDILVHILESKLADIPVEKRMDYDIIDIDENDEFVQHIKDLKEEADKQRAESSIED